MTEVRRTPHPLDSLPSWLCAVLAKILTHSFQALPVAAQFLSGSQHSLSSTSLCSLLPQVSPTLLQPAPEAVFLVQVLSRVQLFVTPWTVGPHSSLSFTISQNLLKLMSVDSMMLSNPFNPVSPFSSYPQSFPASGSFPVSQLFASGGQSIGASASASVLPMNIQGWFLLGLTGLISLLFKGLSRLAVQGTV